MHLHRSLIVVGLAALAIPTRAHAGLIVPPLEADIGKTVPVGDTVTGVATDMLIGVHWASLAWKPTHFEFGIGFMHSTRDLLDPIALARSSAGSSAMSTTGSPQTSLVLNGGYITLGHTLYERHHFRTWVTARGELLHGEFEGRAFSATGAAVRVASELYAPAGLAAPSGGLLGTFAIGVYVEASHVALPDELGPDGVTTGLSIRVPFFGAG